MKTPEDTVYTFTADDFHFSDPDPGDTLESVKILTLPDMGRLQRNNVNVLADDTVTTAQLEAGHLSYVPPANANGDNYTTFTFKVNDGTTDSPSEYTMTINVPAVNAAPTVAIAIPNQTATVGTMFSYQFPAATFRDPDNDPLTYEARQSRHQQPALVAEFQRRCADLCGHATERRHRHGDRRGGGRRQQRDGGGGRIRHYGA